MIARSAAAKLLCGCLLVVVTALPAAAEETKIWSALVLATNAKAPKAPPAELAPFAGKLRVFGYNQFEIIGSHTEKVDDESNSWLLPSDDFFLGVKSQKGGNGEQLLDLKFYQNKRLLVETKARLGPRSPLFIRGPQYGQGRLIVVLLVR